RGEAFAPRLGVPFIGFCALSALAISRWPLQLSIATVFLFAGPHNWMEFRFFLARMPARWGRSKPFFSVGLGGVAALTAGYALRYALGQTWYLSEAGWTAGAALWTTALLLWLCALVHLRARQMRRDRSWVFAVGFALCAAAWLAPMWFGLALVYLHPLVALWFLDRQLKRSRPRWRATYHLCLAALPLLLVLMWTELAHAPNLPEEGALSVLALWAGFGSGYATTRDIYFTFAMAHVLAEAPFLIRLL